MEVESMLTSKMMYLIFGSIGLILIITRFWFEKKIADRKQRDRKEELRLHQDKFIEDKKYREEELRLLRDKFEEEKNIRNEHRDNFEMQLLKIAETSDLLSGKIASKLNEDTRWAEQALERVKLKPHTQSLFALRKGHFLEEKDDIADQFVKLLLQRCKKLVERGNKVYLLIDSGTTLYPIFERIGRISVEIAEDKDDAKWLENLVLSTNNLPGIESLMDFGRINPSRRFSGLAIKESYLLPGIALPIYSAVTGRKTDEAIEILRDEAIKQPGKCVFIGLVTGNWIRLRQIEPHCPVPLARGEGHISFKKTLIKVCDEIYVVTPLGKIFANVTKNQLNHALGFSISSNSPARQPYEEVDIDDDKAKVVKIVSTSRHPGFVLSAHSQTVMTLLQVKYRFFPHEAYDQFTSTQAEEVPHMLFPFTRLPSDWTAQKEIEFPHDYTRNDAFMKAYFSVDQRPVTI